MEISDAMLASALVELKSRESSAIPDNSKIEHTFSEDFERKMNKLISSFDKNGIRTPFFRNTLAKAAVIILSLCLGAFSLVMISPNARAAFKNTVTEIYENHLKFFFVSDDETVLDFSDYQRTTAEYIPEGFVLKEIYNEYEAVGYRYENEEENLSYDIYVSLNDGLAVHTDKDNSNVEEITVSGRNAYLISGKTEEKPYSTLMVAGNKITVTIYGQLNKEEIIKIGKSLKEE